MRAGTGPGATKATSGQAAASASGCWSWGEQRRPPDTHVPGLLTLLSALWYRDPGCASARAPGLVDVSQSEFAEELVPKGQFTSQVQATALYHGHVLESPLERLMGRSAVWLRHQGSSSNCSLPLLQTASLSTQKTEAQTAWPSLPDCSSRGMWTTASQGAGQCDCLPPLHLDYYCQPCPLG